MADGCSYGYGVYYLGVPLNTVPSWRAANPKLPAKNSTPTQPFRR